MPLSVALDGSFKVNNFKDCKGSASSGKGPANLAKKLYLSCRACEDDMNEKSLMYGYVAFTLPTAMGKLEEADWTLVAQLAKAVD